MEKEYKKPRKERKARKYYKYDKTRHIARDYRTGQKMKNRSVQEESDNEESNKETGFVKGSEQAQYDEPLYIVIL